MIWISSWPWSISTWCWLNPVAILSSWGEGSCQQSTHNDTGSGVLLLSNIQCHCKVAILDLVMDKCLIILTDTPPCPKYYWWSYVLVNISVLGGHDCLMPMTWLDTGLWDHHAFIHKELTIWIIETTVLYGGKWSSYECPWWWVGVCIPILGVLPTGFYWQSVGNLELLKRIL